MRLPFKAIFGAFVMGSALAAAPANAADFVLNFSGNTPLDGNTTFRDFGGTNTSGTAETLSVRASAWTIASNGRIYNSYLGVYPQGLGVTSDNESGDYNTHVIDNQYEKDFVLLQFSSAVVLTQFTTSAWAVGSSTKDSDATIGWGNTANAWNNTISLNNSPQSALNTILTQTVAVAGTGSTTSRSLSGGTASNLWLVAASFTNPDGVIDGFKLSGLKASTSGVPEPATWMMLVAGFGVTGAAIRRRRPAKTAATA
jgi:hypothetical protein